MFPIRDDNPNFLTPVVTVGVIALNVASWFLLQGLGAEAAIVRSVCGLGLVPAELLGSGDFPSLGGGHICPVRSAAPLITPLTSMFLHGGWFHLIGNMWFLWIFGNNVEDAMGHLRFLVFYLLCGLAAAALQVVSQPQSLVPVVGASGAIGGVMGAYIVLYPRVRIQSIVVLGFWVTRYAVPAGFMLGYWFVLQLIGGAASLGREGGGVAFWAHVGGFATGALLVFVFQNPALVARHPYYSGLGFRRRPR